MTIHLIDHIAFFFLAVAYPIWGYFYIRKQRALINAGGMIQSNVVRINGRRQVYIPIYRQPGANTLEIVDRMRNTLQLNLERLRELEPEKNKDLALEIVMDQSETVRTSIAGLQLAAGLGALLAGGVVALFLRSWRATVVIVLAIPLSVHHPVAEAVRVSAGLALARIRYEVLGVRKQGSAGP